MNHSPAERHESSHESEQFQSIVDNLATIAAAEAADPERTFQRTMKKAEFAGLGLLHTQQFLEDLHVRITERAEAGDTHGTEIDCLFIHRDGEWQFADTGEAFKISTARPRGGMDAFFKIQRRGDDFVQVGERGKVMSPDEIAAASQLAADFAARAPELHNQ